MLVNVYRVRANDLHISSDHCDAGETGETCESVVFYNEHAAALNELSSKLEDERAQWSQGYLSRDLKITELQSRLDLALAQRDEYQSRLQDAAVDSLKLSKTHNAELIARLDRIRTVIHDHDMWPESKFMAICSVMGEDAYLKEEYGIEPGRPCEHIDDEGGKCLKCGWIQPGVVERQK